MLTARAYPPDRPNDLPSGRIVDDVLDNCECAQTELKAGVPLSGSPTVCCTAHRQWTLALGSFGSFTLYHAGGDIWSTYSADAGEDNPWINDCGGGLEDEYDVVLGAAAKTITLEARAALNCAAVCFEYRRQLPFACQKANQFTLAKFSGTDDPPDACVCLRPDTSGQVPVIPCYSYCDPEQVLPAEIAVVITGTLTMNPVHTGDPAAGCFRCEDVPGSFVLTYNSVNNRYEFFKDLGDVLNCCTPVGSLGDCIDRVFYYYLECDTLLVEQLCRHDPLDTGCGARTGGCYAAFAVTSPADPDDDCLLYEMAGNACGAAPQPCTSGGDLIAVVTSALSPPSNSGHCAAAC